MSSVSFCKVEFVDHAEFVDQAVLELVNFGRVCRVRKQPFIVHPLSVAIQPCDKKR